MHSGCVDAVYDLRSLPGDLLEGVLQRVGGKTKREAERVDRGFAAITRRRAWRHCNKLIVEFTRSYNIHPFGALSLGIGPFEVKSPYDTNAPIVTRFLTQRSIIQHVEFSQDSLWYAGTNGPVQGHRRAILAALLASERVTLLSLVLRDTATRLFGGTDEMVALVRRHSATLRQVALGARDDLLEPTVYAALHSCPNLRHLTAIPCQSFYEWSTSLRLLVSGLQLSSLTLYGGDISRADVSAVLPTLRQLRLSGVELSLGADGADWGALQNVRLFESIQRQSGGLYSTVYTPSRNLPLGDERRMKLILASVLPNLETLILRQGRPSWLSFSFWGDVQVLSKAFLNRPGDHSLAVQLSAEDWSWFGSEAWRQLAEWQAAFPDLTVERFAAVAAEQADDAASARPSLPDEFGNTADSAVFILRRANESRWLLVAISK